MDQIIKMNQELENMVQKLKNIQIKHIDDIILPNEISKNLCEYFFIY